MIETEFRATVHCDHMRYDSAAIKAGILMAGAAAGSLGCSVESGPYSSVAAARDSARVAGWYITLRHDRLLAYCPLHREEAEQFWSVEDDR